MGVSDATGSRCDRRVWIRHASQSSQWSVHLQEPMIGLDGRRFGQGIHLIAPQEGLVLTYVARPKVEVSVSAIPAIVPPGNVVTYVVTYKNRGEAPAQDATVSAQIFDKWCAFEWASDEEKLCGTEVTWAVGDSPPGRAGVRIFSVRVK